MKLALVIVNKKDANILMDELVHEGFHATKLSSTGVFLKEPNATLLIGVEEEEVAHLLDIVKTHSSVREELTASMSTLGDGTLDSYPVRITTGGATVFVLDVDQFHKL